MYLTNLNFSKARSVSKSIISGIDLDCLQNHLLWLKPNHLSLLNMVFSLFAGLSLLILPRLPLLPVLFLIFAYAFDLLDGKLARIRGISSPSGSFIDGSMDRIGEILFIICIYLSGTVFHLYPIIILVVGLLVNYLQLHFNQLGGTIEPVFVEKAERNVIFLVLFILYPVISAFQLNIFWLVFALVQLFSVLQMLSRVQYLSAPTDPTSDTFEEDYSYRITEDVYTT